jgi:hypothetical protein
MNKNSSVSTRQSSECMELCRLAYELLSYSHITTSLKKIYFFFNFTHGGIEPTLRSSYFELRRPGQKLTQTDREIAINLGVQVLENPVQNVESPLKKLSVNLIDPTSPNGRKTLSISFLNSNCR